MRHDFSVTLYQQGRLNIPEALARIDYWTDYMRTGSPADVEKGLSRLSLLHKCLAKELLEN